jgi:trk/ktr system potassium uptake protein
LHIIIAGCGRVGAHLAQFLAYEGHDVVVIDRDDSSFKRLGGTFNGITLAGVAYDEELLLEAGIRSADALAAVTNYDNTNLMTAEIAKNIFGVPKVVARLYNPDKKQTFERLGIEFVCGTNLLAERIRDRFFQGPLVVHYEDPDLGVEVVELTVRDRSRGKPVSSFDDAEKNRILTFFSRNEHIKWDRETCVEPGDRLVMVVREGTKRVLSTLWSDIRWVERDPADQMLSLPMGGSESKTVQGTKVVIAGCGRVGAQLAEMLSQDGNRVTIIDRDTSSFKRLSREFGGEAIAGYSFDEEILERSGIREADMFASVTNYDNVNLMTAEVVKHIFGVPKVIARLYNPDKAETFEALGMDYVCGTALVSREMLEQILRRDLNVIATCCNNTRNIIRFRCPRSLSGKRASWCEDNLRLKIGLLVRQGKLIFPIKTEHLREGDEIIAIIAPRRLPKLERYLESQTGNGRG